MKFGIVTDIHHANADPRPIDSCDGVYRNSNAKLQKAIAELNTQELSFLAQLGDLVDQAPQESEADTKKALQQILSTLDAFEPKGPVAKGMQKVCHVLGNHDVSNLSKTDVVALIDPDFLKKVPNVQAPDCGYNYSFECEGVRFIGVDFEFHPDATPFDHLPYSDPGVGFIAAQTMRDLTAYMLSSKLPIIIFTHQPVGSFLGDDDFTQTLYNYNKKHGEQAPVLAVLSGHVHPGGYHIENGIHFVTHRALLRGGSDQDVSYSIVEVKDDRTVSVVERSLWHCPS